MRRLGSLRRALTPLVCLVTFLMPVAVWVSSTGPVQGYFTLAVPPGQTLFIFSKLFALLAITMFWFQAMSALAKHGAMLAGFPPLGRRAHGFFGAATFAAVLLHLTLFVIASTLRTGDVPWDLLLPAWGHGYYRTMISLGVVAFWVLLVALLAGWLRWRTTRAWHRWLHRLVLVVFALGFLHGVTIGSETRYGLMAYVYAFIGLSLGTVLLYLGRQAVSRRRRALTVAAAMPRAMDGTHAQAE